jgi:hypothetical protein
MFAHLPPPAECLAILVGCAELVVFGLGGLSDHVAFAQGFGLQIDAPAPASPEHALTDNQKTHKALVQAIAARNIQNGALILTLACYTRNRTALGFAVLYGFLTTLADTLLVRTYGVKDLALGHLVGVVNSLAIGGSLLYWTRDDPWPFMGKR